MSKIVTVIDLGSNKIAAAQASIDKYGNISLIALENLNSRGIKGGDISDINKAVEDITSIVNKLRKSGAKKIKNILVTTRGSDMAMKLARGMIPLAKTPREITRKDIKRCLEIASMIKLPLNRAVVQRIIRGFYLDGGSLSINNPVGLYGIRLEAEAFIATANQSKIQNITKCIDHAGFLLEGIYLSSIASASSVLDTNQKEEGVLLLHIGDSLTEGIVFKNNMLKDFRIIKRGASSILAKNRHLDRGKLDTLLKDGLSGLPDDKSDFSSLVVTGEGALLDGLIEESEKLFKKPAKIGIVKNAGRELNSQDAIIHTSTIGLIDYIAKEHRVNQMQRSPIRHLFRKIVDIYESYF